MGQGGCKGAPQGVHIRPLRTRPCPSRNEVQWRVGSDPPRALVKRRSWHIFNVEDRYPLYRRITARVRLPEPPSVNSVVLHLKVGSAQEFDETRILGCFL
jgi:hypothetical protein